METKQFIALGAIPIAIMGGTILSCFSKLIRDLAFFGLVAGVVITERLDVNFLSQEWYRGTTRGIEFALVDILAISVLISSIIAPHHNGRRVYWPASLGFMILFIIWGGVSIAMSEPKLFGVYELSKWIRAVIVFLAAAHFIRGEREIRILILALGCAVALEGLLAIKHKVFVGVDRATGTLEHANSLSMYLLLTAPVFVAVVNSYVPKMYRLMGWACLGLAGIGMLLTLSRMGIPSFALTMFGATLICMTWRFTMKKVVVSVGIAVCGAALVVVAWDGLKERFLSASMEEELSEQGYENRGQYIGLAKAILKDKPLGGVGLNNWSYWVSKKYGPEANFPYEAYDDIPESVLKSPDPIDWSSNYAPPAHNLGVITVGEMGWVGLILFALLWLRWFSMGQRFLWRRNHEITHLLGVAIFFGVCGMFLQSLTEWVYRQTPILFTLHILLGALASLCYARRHAKRIPVEEFETEPAVHAVPHRQQVVVS